MDDLCKNVSSVCIDSSDDSDDEDEFFFESDVRDINVSYHELLELPPLQRYGDLRTLRCSGNSIRVIPDNIGMMRNLTYLNCSENNIGYLPDSMQKLTKLEKLNCSRNYISTLPNLQQCSNLTKLNVSNNQIHHLPPYLTMLPLVKLNCLWNPPTCLDGVDISYFRNMKNLNCDLLQYQYMNLIPYMVSLSTLNSVNNGVKVREFDLEFFLNSLSNLDVNELKISYYDIQTFPMDIINLQHLDISNMKLRELSGNIQKLQRLNYLDFSYNCMQHLPLGLFELKNLKELKFHDNQVISLPSVIGKLENLEVLMVNNNQIQILPPEFILLQNLGVMVMMGNPLRYTPPNIKRMINYLPNVCQDCEGYEIECDEMIENIQNLNLTNTYRGIDIVLWEKLFQLLKHELLITPASYEAMVQSIMGDIILSSQTKSLIQRLTKGPIDMTTLLRFEEILPYVWMVVQHNVETKQRIEQMMSGYVGKPVLVKTLIFHLISLL